MTRKEGVKLSDSAREYAVRKDDEEKWYFSIVDAASVQTDSANPQIYRHSLKRDLTDERNHAVTNCNSVKMRMTEEKQQGRLRRPAPPAGARLKLNSSTI